MNDIELPEPVAWRKPTPSGDYLRSAPSMADTPETDDGLNRNGWRPLYTSEQLQAYGDKRAANALEAMQEDIDALRRTLRLAEIRLRDRQHPAIAPRDPPEVLRSLGFWPDCGCGECYAIHCLDAAMNAHDAAREALAEPAPTLTNAFEEGWRVAANWMERDDLIADIGSPMYLEDRNAALSAIGRAVRSTT